MRTFATQSEIEQNRKEHDEGLLSIRLSLGNYDRHVRDYELEEQERAIDADERMRLKLGL